MLQENSVVTLSLISHETWLITVGKPRLDFYLKK